MSFSQLSNELLALIFLFTESPSTFSLISRSTHRIATDPFFASQYIVHRHGLLFAVHSAICYPKLVSRDLITRLLAAGAELSLSLLVALHAKCLNESDVLAPKILDGYDLVFELGEKKWGLKFGPRWEEEDRSRWDLETTIGLETFVAWEHLTILLRQIRVNTGRAIMDLAFPAPVVTELEDAVEGRWFVLKASIEKYGFPSVSEADALNLRISRAVCLEPRLIPVLKVLKWEFNRERQDDFLRGILFTTDPGPELDTGRFMTRFTRADMIYNDLELMLKSSNGLLQVSATVVGEVLALDDHESRHTLRDFPNAFATDAKAVLSRLHAAKLLQFDLSEIEAELLRLAHHTIVTEQRGIWLVGLTTNLRKEKSTGLAIASILSLAVNVLQVNPAESGGPVKSRMCIVDSLLHPFAPESQLTNTLYMCAKHVGFSIPLLIEELAKKIVRAPTRGALLLELVALYPYLKSYIRDEVLAHRIHLKNLPPSTSQDAYRPTFSNLRPNFLSPLAFDYANAKLRFPSSLGPNPWVELGYSPTSSSRSVDPNLSTSIWPMETKEFIRKVGDEEVRLGKVTGRIPQRSKYTFTEGRWGVVPPESNEWIYERIPDHSLPVAIALLDLFEKKDEVLDVMLTHALLNLNPIVANFYLAEGVPLRSHHLKIVDRLGIPQLECVKAYLENGRKVPEEKKVKSRGKTSQRKLTEKV